MKKIYLIYLIVAIFAVQMVSAAPSLQANLSKYEPFPAAPGDTVKVWILVQNTAPNDNTDTARNVVVELIPSHPFSIYNDVTTKTIPVLGARKDYLVDFNLRIDQNALQGDNTFKVRVRDSTSSIEQEQTLSLFVQSRDSTISIESVRIEPNQIAPGSTGTVTITVKNIAPTTFTDLNMKLYLQSIIGGTLVDLPFAPVSSAEKRIYKLDPDQTAQFSYELTVYPDAAARIYKIPFILEYSDNIGNRKNKSDFIGLTVNSVPEVSVVLDSTAITRKTPSGDVTLRVINKGLGDIKFLNVIITPTDAFEISSTSDTIYVGNLQSDDYQSVDYALNVKSKDQRIQIPVTLQYRDANNQYYESTQNVTLNVVNPSGNGSSPSGWMIFLVVVILVIAGWIIYKRSKKNKQ